MVSAALVGQQHYAPWLNATYTQTLSMICCLSTRDFVLGPCTFSHVAAAQPGSSLPQGQPSPAAMLQKPVLPPAPSSSPRPAWPALPPHSPAPGSAAAPGRVGGMPHGGPHISNCGYRPQQNHHQQPPLWQQQQQPSTYGYMPAPGYAPPPSSQFVMPAAGQQQLQGVPRPMKRKYEQ